ncbi:hypothetical protein XELAEV_18006367mg [Xenopus laevis]|uniref:Uncharacterized protein n=1 Tax=Xenopus laevis TaxID=8355 RepID=A0A974DZ42_XENLA|nr:hypothetical protein XELAEV_18006367mg [Xenopus laevis]
MRPYESNCCPSITRAFFILACMPMFKISNPIGLRCTLSLLSNRALSLSNFLCLSTMVTQVTMPVMSSA